ncbi:MAG: hypothetical protein RLZZ292_2429 [Bacteroidota bacterium]|jgi:hypothetical protein
MNETIFFDHPNVLVTNARFVANEQTYAMRNITSVQKKIQPMSLVPYLVLGFIALCCFQDSTSAPVGVFCVIGMVYLLYNQKTEYYVAVHTSGVEQRTITSTNEDFINQTVQAINHAMVFIG